MLEKGVEKATSKARVIAGMAILVGSNGWIGWAVLAVLVAKASGH